MPGAYVTEQTLEAFIGKGGSTALEHIVGLPYVLLWECTL